MSAKANHLSDEELTADGQWCPACGEPSSVCGCLGLSEDEEDDEIDGCLHGVPWCDECAACNDDEDEWRLQSSRRQASQEAK